MKLSKTMKVIFFIFSSLLVGVFTQNITYAGDHCKSCYNCGNVNCSNCKQPICRSNCGGAGCTCWQACDMVPGNWANCGGVKNCECPSSENCCCPPFCGRLNICPTCGNQGVPSCVNKLKETSGSILAYFPCEGIGLRSGIKKVREYYQDCNGDVQTIYQHAILYQNTLPSWDYLLWTESHKYRVNSVDGSSVNMDFRECPTSYLPPDARMLCLNIATNFTYNQIITGSGVQGVFETGGLVYSTGHGGCVAVNFGGWTRIVEITAERICICEEEPGE